MNFWINSLLNIVFLAYFIDIKVTAVISNRNQLKLWYPNFLTNTWLDLNRRNITSISSETFDGLNNLQTLFMSTNNLTSLDSSIF